MNLNCHLKWKYIWHFTQVCYDHQRTTQSAGKCCCCSLQSLKTKKACILLTWSMTWNETRNPHNLNSWSNEKNMNKVWENKQISLKLKRNNKFYWKLYQIVFIKLQNIAQEKKSIQEKDFDSYMSHTIRIKHVIEFKRTSSVIRFNNQIQ